MNPDIKQAWLAALRSGEYEQGTKSLRRAGLLCCLGVLCEVHRLATGAGQWVPEPDGDQYYLNENEMLPKEVVAWAGLPDSNPILAGHRATAWNDGAAELNTEPLTFTEIADLIERHL